eukprot:CAMPEP_0196780216 /NCGR_PEP_ID=MMETSP1104-20130614/7285_1 /TAXON_ID=33652 /ORGANISM="Cafeteria sp., Strain Caron Lab Isolate" /LENGTH=343 /DNA_ID=CAMNT_0042150413 /DNA_START=6 /DNA_END=1037 /DNA_ORIENTATION=+
MSEARTTRAWVAKEAKAPVVAEDIELPPLASNHVEVKVEACGICHSDLHLIDGDWGPFSAFPCQVSGHEVVGRVTTVGEGVSHLHVGDLVGIGWQRDACHHCEWCLKGEHQLCDGNMATCAGGGIGGFADYWRGPSEFAFKIPDGLKVEHVGPLMCGGITVFSPLVKHSKAGDRVGVVGIGGLGHMAVRFARARGCLVTAITSSPDKVEDAKAMGAHKVVVSRDAEQMKAAANSLDLIIVTVTVSLDWDPYMAMLRPMGTLCFVGAIQEPMKLPVFGDMIMKNLNVAGSCIGGRSRMAEMLQFAADHHVEPIVEVVPFDKINEALDRVRANKQRFRMVLSHNA